MNTQTQPLPQPESKEQKYIKTPIPGEVKQEESINKGEKNPLSFQKKPQFVLDGMRVNSKLVPYNGLIDKHLAPYFSNDKLRVHLLKMGLINDSGHIIEGKKKKIRKVEKLDENSNNELKINKIKHKNSLENEYIDKLPKLPDSHNESHIILPKIYLANLKFELKSGRDAGSGSMPKPKIKDQSYSNPTNFYTKKAVHNNTKLQSLSKDDLTKVFMKYKAKVSNGDEQNSITHSKNNSNINNNNNNENENQKKTLKTIEQSTKNNQKEQPKQNEILKSKPSIDKGLVEPPTKQKSIELPTKKKSIEIATKINTIEQPQNSINNNTIDQPPAKTMNFHTKKNNGGFEDFEILKTNANEKKKEEDKIHDEVIDEKKESPLKETEKIEESPIKPNSNADEGKYDEEIFEDPIEKS